MRPKAGDKIACPTRPAEFFDPRVDLGAAAIQCWAAYKRRKKQERK